MEYLTKTNILKANESMLNIYYLTSQQQELSVMAGCYLSDNQCETTPVMHSLACIGGK